MLALTFEVGSDRVAVDVRRVREVVPWVRLSPLSGRPSWVAGVFVYRGRVIPVIDLHRLSAKLLEAAHDLVLDLGFERAGGRGQLHGERDVRAGDLDVLDHAQGDQVAADFRILDLPEGDHDVFVAEQIRHEGLGFLSHMRVGPIERNRARWRPDTTFVDARAGRRRGLTLPVGAVRGGWEGWFARAGKTPSPDSDCAPRGPSHETARRSLSARCDGRWPRV